MTTETLVERARLTEAEMMATGQEPEPHMWVNVTLLDTQLAKALREVVKWLHREYGWVAIKHIQPPGDVLEAELEALEKPSG